MSSSSSPPARSAHPSSPSLSLEAAEFRGKEGWPLLVAALCRRCTFCLAGASGAAPSCAAVLSQRQGAR
eukprot:6251686-Pyramimonas_sp.AAC.1